MIAPRPLRLAALGCLALALGWAAPARALELRKHAYGITSATLDNGLEIIIVENHALPLATVMVAAKNGSFTETPEFNGLSHLYEHMFFKGNGVIPNQERYMARLRELGAMWNGTTSEERVNYFLTVHKKNLREGAVFMRDALLLPLFKEEELRREWPVVLGEFDRDEAEPSFHLQREIDRIMWAKYFSRKNPIGDRDVIFHATRAQMREIQRRYYVPNNCVAIVGGDVEPGETADMIQELFGKWTRGDDPSVKWPVPEHPPLEKASRIVVTGPVRTATIAIEWQGPGMVKDTPATFAADALSTILAQPRSSFQKALVDTGLVDDIAISYQSLVHTGPIALSATTSADRLDKAWAAIQAEIEKLDDPAYIPDDQIEAAKSALEIRGIHERERTSSFCDALAYWWCTAGLDYYLHYAERLRALKREDLVRYVQTYLKGKPRVEAALVGPKDAEKIEFAKTAQVITPKSGSSGALPAAPAAASAVTTEEFDVDGLKVVLRRNPASEIVVTQALILGGLPYCGAEAAGRELVLLETLDKGSKSFSKEEANRQLSKTGASLSAEARPDYSIFGLSTLARDLDANFAVFADALARPLLDETECKLAVERRLSAIKMQEEEPDAYISVLANRNFFKGHPYEAPATGVEKAMAGLDAAALRKIHAQTIVRSRVELIVVGDVEKERLAGLVRAGLRDVPRGDFKPRRAAREEGQAPRLLTEKRDLPTNYILGLFQAPNPSAPDYPAMEVALSILSDRLFEEVRTKRNLTYAVAAELSSRASNFGALYVTAVKPGETLPVMMAEVDRLAAEPVSDKELKDKIEEMITGDLMRKEANSSQAASLVLYEAVGGGWANEAKALDRLAEVTPAKVMEAAARYLKAISFGALGDPEKIDPKLFTAR